MSIFDSLNEEIKPREMLAAGILTRGKTSGYVCPFCKSGEGDKGTGMTHSIYHGQHRYFCWKCHKSYTNYVLISEVKGYSAKEIAKFAKEEWNLKEEGSYKPKGHTVEQPKPSIDFSEFIHAAQKNLLERGESIRGVGLDVWQRVQAGLATSAELWAVNEKVPAGIEFLILPYEGANQFQIRSLYDEVTGITRKRVSTGFKRQIYNPYGATLKNQLVFVVEGEIDCVSICAALQGDIATIIDTIAVGGKEMFKALPEWLKAKGITPNDETIFVLIGDNDKAGQDGATAGKKAMLKAGYLTASEILHETYDANKFLQEGKAAELLERLVVIVSKVTADKEKIIEEREKEMREVDETPTADKKFKFNRIGEYFSTIFDNQLNAMKPYVNRKTGFSNIDEYQKLFPGLYVIGGLPAIGKTTFAWQILENLARAGETCIYCSYEMAEIELFAKSLNRAVNQEFAAQNTVDYETEEVLTSASIRASTFPESHTGQWKEIFARQRAILNSVKWNLTVFELADETIDDLLEEMEKICAESAKPPIICLDYLQIIPSGKDTAKGAIDDIVRKLKIFQRSTDTTFFIISSFNRDNYSADVEFKSFKESGGIEYTADVIWGLQFYNQYANTPETLKPKDEPTTRAEITKAGKEKSVRDIELVCLKNRNGIGYHCNFKYYAPCDWFIADDLAGEYVPDKNIPDAIKWK